MVTFRSSSTVIRW